MISVAERDVNVLVVCDDACMSVRHVCVFGPYSIVNSAIQRDFC